MAVQRLVVIFCAAAILLTGLAYSKKNDQSKTFGKQGPEDKLLYKERVDFGFLFDGDGDGDGSPLVPTYKKNVTYPRPPATEGSMITCIKVVDNMISNQNGMFEITSGGVNETHATVYFFNRQGYAIMYTVEFYGKPK